MKGIVMAGGTGSRLFPVTAGGSKHLLPIYNKPMIYYPISVLMLAGIRDIFLICNESDLKAYKSILGDGGDYGVSIDYGIQETPGGIAEAFIVGEQFIGKDSVCLILGDNIFFGQGLSTILKQAKTDLEGGVVFSYRVANPRDFGVLEFDDRNGIVDIVEKPDNPKSSFAVTGLYMYSNDVVSIAKSVRPSLRGEKEITSVNKSYLNKKRLSVVPLGRGFCWLDAGNFENLLAANNLISTAENRQGLKVGCLEEIGLSNGWISREELSKKINLMPAGEYKNYALGLLE